MATGLQLTSRERIFSVHAISSRADMNIAEAPWEAASLRICEIFDVALSPAYLTSWTKTFASGSSGRSVQIVSTGLKAVSSLRPCFSRAVRSAAVSLIENSAPSIPTVDSLTSVPDRYAVIEGVPGRPSFISFTGVSSSCWAACRK